jgi:hypothetical protein
VHTRSGNLSRADILFDASSHATMPRVPEAAGIYRGEVLAIMEALADILVDVRHIRRILEDNDEAEEEEDDS